MTATRPQPRPGVLDIAPYVPGKSSAPGVAKVFKLSSNETPLGPSPKAIAAYQRGGRAAARIIRTARRPNCARRSARAFGLDPARIVCGAGSDDLLNLLARAYLADGDEAIHTHARLPGLPDRDARHRRETGRRAGEGLHRRRRRHPRGGDAAHASIVFLANPNNPTGTYVPFDEIKRLHRGLPPHVLLVLDAAYAEYVQRNDYEAGIELVATCENVVMCRTFSKIHGLAALRLGWMYGPAHIVDALNRMRGPFNVNAPAIDGGHRGDRGHRACQSARARTMRTGWPG